ncbi:hypothetical protein [Gemmata sp.]|uniref:hypothetical protein n=1 Tax=Gemmata sp. TaxID=1914242 RepID=UPI003F714E9A
MRATHTTTEQRELTGRAARAAAGREAMFATPASLDLERRERQLLPTGAAARELAERFHRITGSPLAGG